MRALAPHWGALLALALFMVVGLAVLDDYGVTLDESYHRGVFLSKLTQLQGEHADIHAERDNFYFEHDNYYGGAFHFPLLFAEPAFGLRGAREIYLSRHLLTHLFFLVGGLFAYLLALRLFNTKTLALLAMLIFLLHPRLYAHSFFNAQDIPFAAMFAVALFLAHRAFRRDTVAAFVLLGVGIGVLLNLRIMGVVLLAAIPALRALDLAFASGWAERKRVLLTTGAVVLSSAVATYALLPYLWSNPIERAAEWWALLSAHPNFSVELFRGTAYTSMEFPADYVPVWFSVTSPPFALLLGVVGAAAVLARAVRAPMRALRSAGARIGLLLVGCFALPILAVIVIDANIYNGWRHLYFLWAPFALLAVVGLAALIRALARPRAAAYGAAGAGLAATLASMALIHPNQQVFFNFSVDRGATGYLGTQYTMDYWRHPGLQALEWVLNNIDPIPGETTGMPAYWDVWDVRAENMKFLPDSARARIEKIKESDHVRILQWSGAWARSARSLHRAQVYSHTIFRIERTDDLQAVYDATREREPDDVGAYDVYRLDGAVALVMEPCAPAFIRHTSAILRATPVDPGDLPPAPPWREDEGYEPRRFPLIYYGRRFDGKCVASLPLPDYPIADIEFIWEPELLSSAFARGAAARAKADGRLLARSAYDVHLANGELVYIQEPCDPLGTEPPFHVSVFQEVADDSPEKRRGWGREPHEFGFHERGALLEDGTCVALFPLPDEPIAGIETGQRMQDGSSVWAAAFSVNPSRYAAAYRAVAGSEPLAHSAFDLHLLDGDLVYVKEPCEQAGTEARFFLHIVPERVGDLPEERREFGFDNLDFRFFLNGAWFDGRCAARVPLPSYPIASVRTGQFVSGAGEVWSAEFAMGR